MMSPWFSLTGRTLSDTSLLTAYRRPNVMLAYSHNPSSISAWPPLMVAIALTLMLGVGTGLLPTQSGEAEAADPVKIVPPNPPVLNQAKHLIEKGDPESAATVLRRFLTTTPPPEHLDDTYLLLGAALYGLKDYGEALRYLNQLQTEFPESDLVDRGKLLLARTHAAMGNIDR
jgi:branched-chain amino acid transport system substrate-binding protein